MATVEARERAQARLTDGPHKGYAIEVRRLLGYFPEDKRDFLTLREAETKTSVKHTTVGTMARGFRADVYNTRRFAEALGGDPDKLLRLGGYLPTLTSTIRISDKDGNIVDFNPRVYSFTDNKALKLGFHDLIKRFRDHKEELEAKAKVALHEIYEIKANLGPQEHSALTKINETEQIIQLQALILDKLSPMLETLLDRYGDGNNPNMDQDRMDRDLKFVANILGLVQDFFEDFAVVKEEQWWKANDVE